MEKEKFNAYKYANEFEELSLEIINITFFEGNNEKNILEKVHTQETRDNGVDGYIRFSIDNSIYTYTVEAKLRTCDTLGINDFASSILHSLINFSTRHFVVTNISYSKDALNVINCLNAQKKGNIDLVDGKRLQDIINKNIDNFSKYSDILMEYILSKSFEQKFQGAGSAIAEEQEQISVIFTHYLEQSQRDILRQYERGERFFIVEGCADTGKTTFIENTMFALSVKYQKNMHIFDMELLSTPRLFMTRIVEVVSGINILALLEYLSKKDTNELLLASSKEIDFLKDLGVAIRILFDPDTISKEEQTFYMNELLYKAVSRNYFNDSNILYFKNVEKVSSKQLSFFAKIIKIFPENRITVFLELLTPFCQKQVRYISLEEWFDKCALFKSSKYENHSPVLIKLKNYTCDEKADLINKYLNMHLSTAFLRYLTKELGDVPGNFHLGLDYVARNKLYTIPLLKNYHSKLHSSNMLFIMFFSDYCNKQKDNGLLTHAVTVAYLLEDFIPEQVISMFSAQYNCDAQANILKSPFFTVECGKIKIVDRQIYNIENLITPIKIKDISKEILTVIENIYVDYYEKIYFSCLLNIYAGNELNECEIKKSIQLLEKRNAVSRIETLLYSIYNFMDNRNYDIKEKLHLLVYYIKFVNKQYLYTTEKVSYFLTQAENLYDELEYSEGYTSEEDEVGLQIDYCEAMYYRQKMSYNYKECQRFVSDILKYEVSFPQFQKQYANAHIWQALIYKEHGFYREEFREYIQTIRKYPYIFNVKKSFLMNASAHYYFKSPQKALLILNDLIETVRKNGDDYKVNMWLYHDWLMLKMYNKEYDLEFLYKMRNYAERYTASNVLTRNFNMEGYFFTVKHDYKKALECFETAVLINKTAGKNKAYFLFLTNLITIKKSMNLSIEEELQEVNSWLKLHTQIIHERLENTKKISTENLFAALTSCIIACSDVIGIGDIVKEQINENLFDFSQITDPLSLIHSLFVLDDKIIILF